MFGMAICTSLERMKKLKYIQRKYGSLFSDYDYTWVPVPSLRCMYHHDDGALVVDAWRDKKWLGRTGQIL